MGAHLPPLRQLSWFTGCSGTKPSAPPRLCTPCSTAWRCSSPSSVSAGAGAGRGAGCVPGGDGLLSAGIVAVFESHRTKSIPDMYSLHSWCGMAAFVLYLLQVRAGEPPGDAEPPAPRDIPVTPPQWLLGCGFFLLPRASFSLRSRYKPRHVFFGIALFALSIAACLLGITEMLLFNIKWVTELSPPSKGLFQPRGAVWPLPRLRGYEISPWGLYFCCC